MPSTTLHMEVESVLAMQSNLQNQYDNITSTLSALRGKVHNSVGTDWKGTSADQFLGRFDAIDSSITQQIEGLKELADALRREIEQWQSMSSALG